MVRCLLRQLRNAATSRRRHHQCILVLYERRLHALVAVEALEPAAQADERDAGLRRLVKGLVLLRADGFFVDDGDEGYPNFRDLEQETGATGFFWKLIEEGLLQVLILMKQSG